jgi:hypothetical protein
MRRGQVLEIMVKAINEKVKQNWSDGTNVSHDIATIINLVKASGHIDDWQANQLFHEGDGGYQLTYSFLFDLGLTKSW